MHLCGCVNEERGDGEGVGSEVLSDTLRYINLAGLVIGMFTFRGPMHLRAGVIKEGGEGPGSQSLSDTFRYINLAGLATGLVALRGPMHLRACVSEERGEDGGERVTLRSDVL